ncbi:protein of unknown function [Cupriavidus neocaledonicus]|uniref:Uncharacterized protein n=1 Tax=Cupriavidus neocaledonicus TaxID=1040979 RepID=A0A375HBW8_9BURK|nr:hypothetical protein CBM2605_A230099 [Cupriavidus neocaledonicus]SPD47809.1 protein of unknown function [Cupriavidus neocaledonicus]
MQWRLPPAYAATSTPWKTLVTLWKHPVTLISSCNKLHLGAIHKIKGLARLARKSLVFLLQDERQATAATAAPGGKRLYGSRVTLAALHGRKGTGKSTRFARLQQGWRRGQRQGRHNPMDPRGGHHRGRLR